MTKKSITPVAPELTEVCAASLTMVNEAVAKAKANAGWQSNSSQSFVREVLIQAEQTLKAYEEVSKPSAHALRFMIEQLRLARRIRIGVPLIPNKIRMETPATMQKHSLGLVYSSTEPLAIEYEHAGVYDASADLTHALSTRRLALVIPLDSEFALNTRELKDFKHEETDQGAVMVWSINYFEEKKEWEFAPTAAVIPRYQAIEFMKSRMGSLTRCERITRKLGEKLGERFDRFFAQSKLQEESTVLGDPIAVQFQDMLPELIRQLASDQIRQISREVSMDACWVALGAMNALACSDVELKLLENIPGGAEQPMMSGATMKGVPVDPFHGVFDLDWKGNWRWRQGLTEISMQGNHLP